MVVFNNIHTDTCSGKNCEHCKKMKRLAPIYSRIADETLKKIASDPELKDLSRGEQFDAFQYTATAILVFCITLIDTLEHRIYVCQHILEMLTENFEFNCQTNNITGETH